MYTIKWLSTIVVFRGTYGIFLVYLGHFLKYLPFRSGMDTLYMTSEWIILSAISEQVNQVFFCADIPEELGLSPHQMLL